MREILFRGRRIDNGEWVEGFYYSVTRGAHCNPIMNMCEIMTFEKLTNGEIVLTGTYDVGPSTIGEYTGLTDKNGKKIFENDILHVLEVGTETNEYVSTVRWEDGEYLLSESKTNDVPLSAYSTKPEYQMNPLHEIEVIGNRFDTPELLEGEKK